MNMRRAIKPLIDLRGRFRFWYLEQIYLPVVRNGGDLGKISLRLSQADWHESQVILRVMNARIDSSAYIETNLLIHNARPDYSNLSVGAGAYVGKDCFLDLSERITLETNVTLAMRVTILTHFDGGNSFASEIYGSACDPVLIRSGAYVGAGAILMPGIIVETDAIVAAGAVVNKNVPARTLVGGVPARVIRSLPNP